MAVSHYKLFPEASATSGAITVGLSVGLVVSLFLLASGIIKRSYDNGEDEGADEPKNPEQEPEFNHRIEVLKEVLFLLPMIIFGFLGFYLNSNVPAVKNFWFDFFSQSPVIGGVLGSLWGYFIGCAVVWATRILGTLGFGKEAMGLGDVHLMGAAGAVIGWDFVVLAFFIAPFFGLVWAFGQMFFKKTHQIPYGPFLSLAVFMVMILHDWFRIQLSEWIVYS